MGSPIKENGLNAKKKYILALDQGTTSSRAILFDTLGNMVRSAQKEFKQIYPRSGWVEHDPEEILSSQLEVMKIVSSGCENEIISVGIANQRESVVVWDKTSGKSIYNAIVWQCRRTADECKRLVDEGYEDLIYERTGLTLDAYFSATKLGWILENVSGAKERAKNGELLFGTVDSFLIWHLTGGRVHATDYTNAARTMLFNIHTLDWDEDLVKIFDVPKSMLPRVQPSASDFGTVCAGMPCAGIEISAAAGDQQAALAGHKCFEKGSVKNTYGTGCFLLMNTGSEPVVSKRGLITTLAASGVDRPDYVLEGSVFAAGAVVQWLRDEMGIISSSAESETVAKSVNDSGGVYIVPAFTGLGAPYWDASARGTVTGLSRGVTRAHFVRAALESIAYRVFDVVHAMERDLGEKVKRISADGGAAKNNFLMSFQADILSREIIRPAFTEATALGVMYLCALSRGLCDMKTLASAPAECEIFRPHMTSEKRDALLEGWKTAVMRARMK